MPKNKIEDLRNILFETLEKLMDEEDPMDLDRAESVAKVAQVVVNSAKVEIDFLKQTGHGGSNFLQAGASPGPRQLTPVPTLVKPLRAQNIGGDNYVDLCTKCPLPDCDDTSPQCLIQIERRVA